MQVWSGRVVWRSADGHLCGSFAACGHPYPPAACTADKQLTSSSSGSSSRYWARYRLLPPVLQFTVDVQARGFETGPWQQPTQVSTRAAAAAAAGGVVSHQPQLSVQGSGALLADNGSSRPHSSAAGTAAAPAAAAPLCAGWDCCPLVLVPGRADDVQQMNYFIMTLRNSRGDVVSKLVKKRSMCKQVVNRQLAGLTTMSCTSTAYYSSSAFCGCVDITGTWLCESSMVLPCICSRGMHMHCLHHDAA
jgi:hypothetical protein